MDERTCVWIREVDSDRKWLLPSCAEGLDAVSPSTVIFDWLYCPYCGGVIHLRVDDPFMQPQSADCASGDGK